MFTVLWFGYIVLVHGVVVRRGGQAPLLHRRGWFLALFPVSATGWWSFEYLNQFVANWYYSGVEAESDRAYALQPRCRFPRYFRPSRALAHGSQRFRACRRLRCRRYPRLVRLRRARLQWASPASLASASGRICCFLCFVLGPLYILGGLQALLLGESLLASPRTR